MPAALRITSGIAKNKKLEVPEVPGIRPVQEVVKLAIFSILGEKVEGAKVLDLFAGSGNLGLEALSRGAAWCDFVDEAWEAKQTILKNIKNCGFEDKAAVHMNSAVKYVGNTEKKYDIIFLDPFYKNTSHIFLLSIIGEILDSEGIIFFLHGDEMDIENLIKGSNLNYVGHKKYGKTKLTMLQ